MTVSLETLRNKLKFNQETLKDNEETKENFNKAVKLEDGKNKFRLVTFDDGSVVKRMHVHMNLGIPFLCPKKHGGEYCPSCDFGWVEYNKNGKKHTKDDKNNDVSKAFLSQEKFVFRGILRSKEEADFKTFGHPMLRWYDASPTLAKQILAFCTEQEQYGDVTDIVDGTDLILTKDADKAKLRQQSVTCDLDRKARGLQASTPVISLSTDDSNFISVIEKMIAAAPKLEDRFAIKTAEEIDELMKKARDTAKVREEESGFTDTSTAFAEAEEELENVELDKLF